jgi:hypothetical protein
MRGSIMIAIRPRVVTVSGGPAYIYRKEHDSFFRATASIYIAGVPAPRSPDGGWNGNFVLGKRGIRCPSAVSVCDLLFYTDGQAVYDEIENAGQTLRLSPVPIWSGETLNRWCREPKPDKLSASEPACNVIWAFRKCRGGRALIKFKLGCNG